jgi:signal transduction histidine kinase
MRGHASSRHVPTANSSPRALERQVRELQEVLAERDAELSSLRGASLLNAELLATVSHELRSPLTMVKGYAATLRKHGSQLSPEERAEFLDNITEACYRLEIVIARLLELSRLETGILSLEPSAVDLVALARESVVATRAMLSLDKASRLSFDVRVAVEAPVLPRASAGALDVWGDPQRLREVLDALLDNACKYSPDGGWVEIAIQPAARDDPHLGPMAPPMLELCVRDTGMGIPEDRLERIFERFHRVDMRLTREVQGLGVGLTLCKRIIELHGGAIWAESNPGVGSAFHVMLPRVDVKQEGS